MTSKYPSVLIVDDEQVVCELLYDDLSERGYLCQTALHGNDAFTKLATQDFDLVLLDIRLPGMSGMEVLREIRLNHGNTATIMITAVKDVNTVIEAMKMGASDYIVKPFDLDRINASICAVLDGEKRLSQESDYQIPIGGQEEDKQVMLKSFNEIDAIACGIAMRHDLLTGHSNIVSQEATHSARGLGIPEEHIQRWASMRTMLNSERRRLIESSLAKLGRSPLAQSIMGVTVLHTCTPDFSES